MDSDEVFMSSGIHVSFIPSGGSNILSGWKLKDISLSGITIDQQEITHQLSADGFKEFRSMFADAGDATANCYYDPDVEAIPSESVLRASIRSGPQGTFSLTYVEYASESDTTGTATTFFSCGANLQSCGNMSGGIGTPFMTDFKFKLSGKPTYGPGT